MDTFDSICSPQNRFIYDYLFGYSVSCCVWLCVRIRALEKHSNSNSNRLAFVMWYIFGQINYCGPNEVRAKKEWKIWMCAFKLFYTAGTNAFFSNVLCNAISPIFAFEWHFVKCAQHVGRQSWITLIFARYSCILLWTTSYEYMQRLRYNATHAPYRQRSRPYKS